MVVEKTGRHTWHLPEKGQTQPLFNISRRENTEHWCYPIPCILVGQPFCHIDFMIIIDTFIFACSFILKVNSTTHTQEELRRG